jgi:IclR family pca regulon transcriptional regulator
MTDEATTSTPAPGSDAPTRRRARGSAPNASDQMGGFAKGLAVIEAYGHGRSSLTIAEVSRISGLDRASARRCLLTLVNAGYVTTDGRYFELTPRILRLGHAYLAAPLPRLIQPTLDQLATALGTSVSASVLDGKEIVYIARAAQHRIIGVGLNTGSRLPAYCSAMGRVMLASLPLEQSRALLIASDRKQFTPRTLTELDALMAELERVRHLGYSIIDQEIELGSMSVAVPVRNTTGRTVAALVVAFHVSSDLSQQIATDVLPRLLEAQRQLAEILP